jgi:hypothetical protein
MPAFCGDGAVETEDADGIDDGSGGVAGAAVAGCAAMTMGGSGVGGGFVGCGFGGSVVAGSGGSCGSRYLGDGFGGSGVAGGCGFLGSVCGTFMSCDLGLRVMPPGTVPGVEGEGEEQEEADVRGHV